MGAVGADLDCQWAGLASEANFSARRTRTSCRAFATLTLSCSWSHPKLGWISAPPGEPNPTRTPLQTERY